MENAFVVIIIVLMTLIFIVNFYKLVCQGNKKRLEYIKNYKNINFIWIYMCAFPLFLIGIRYTYSDNLIIITKSIRATIELVILRVDFNLFTLIYNTSQLYKLAITLCISMSIINLLLFSFSIANYYIINYIKYNIYTFFKRKLNIVIGFNNDTYSLIKTVPKNTCIVYIEKKNTDAIDFLKKLNIVYKIYYFKVNIKSIFKKIKFINKKEINIICEIKDSKQNVLICEDLFDYIHSNNLYSLKKNERWINFYLMYETNYKSIFQKLIRNSNGIMHANNKHNILAIDFIKKFPITEFMNQEHIDYSDGTVREEIEPNIIMVGFGKVNQEILLTSLASNQLITKKKNKIKEKLINYFIYDKEDSKNNKNFNHEIFKYDHEFLNFEKNMTEYLPLPPKAGNLNFYKININNSEFYLSLKKNLSNKENKKVYNYIIISYDEDLENLDLAQKLLLKVKEWDLTNSTKIFVRVSDDNLVKTRLVEDKLDSKNMFLFGFDTISCNFYNIINENIEKIAMERNRIYLREKELVTHPLTEKEEMELEEKFYYEWFKYTPLKMKSNILAALSIRSKLHLMKLDIKYGIDENKITLEEFKKIYFGDEKIVFIDENHIKYGLEILNNLRHNLGYLEHLRWNAYLLSCGFVPSKIIDFSNPDKNFGNDYDMRIHRNLTTNEGLVKYREIMADNHLKENNTHETKEELLKRFDVIKHDLEFLDQIYYVLKNLNFSIVKR